MVTNLIFKCTHDHGILTIRACYICLPTYCSYPLVMRVFSVRGVRISLYDATGSDLLMGPMSLDMRIRPQA